MRRWVGPVLGILLVVEIIAAVGIVMAQPGGFGSLFAGGFGPERRQELPMRVLELNGQSANINLNSTAGRINIVGDASLKGIEVRATKIIRSNDDREFDKLKLEVTQNGTEIKIEVQQEIRPMFGFSPSIEIRLAAPPEMLASLTGKVGSADVTLRDLQSSKGVVNFSTGSGDVTAENNQLAQMSFKTGSGDVISRNFKGELNLETGSGNVTASDTQGARLVLKTGSGDIRTRGFKGALEASTGSGDIRFEGEVELSEVQVNTGSGDVEGTLRLPIGRNGSINTGSGNIDLRLSDGKAPGLNITTTSGDIKVEVPNTAFENKSKREVRTNGSAVITVRTGSGDVTIK